MKVNHVVKKCVLVNVLAIL